MEKQKSVVLALRSLSNLLCRKKNELQPDCKPKDFVSMTQGHVIAYLFMNEGKDIFQRDMENEFEMRRPTATKILQGMEKSGLITRHEVDYDARLKKIRLTEKACKLHEEMVRRAGVFERRLTDGLTCEEIELFLTIISKMKKNLE